jgi:dTDP-4-dehydrorhamnose 3,5-epimerase
VKVTPTPLAGLLVIEPRIFEDERGFFLESWNEARFAEAGISVRFIQDNHSRSVAGVMRGMHYTARRPQAQMVYVSQGEIFDVAVDLRPRSPTFGKWHGLILSGERPRQFFLPPGFAHGFQVLSGPANIHYKTTHAYDAGDEFTLRCSDPQVAIDWPLAQPLLKDRDAQAPLLAELGPDRLPHPDFGS